MTFGDLACSIRWQEIRIIDELKANNVFYWD